MSRDRRDRVAVGPHEVRVELSTGAHGVVARVALERAVRASCPTARGRPRGRPRRQVPARAVAGLAQLERARRTRRRARRRPRRGPRPLARHEVDACGPSSRCSSPHRSHLLGGVAGARHVVGEPVELGQVLVGQLELERAEVLLQALDALGARDRDDVVAARRAPTRARPGPAWRRGARRPPRPARPARGSPRGSRARSAGSAPRGASRPPAGPRPSGSCRSGSRGRAASRRRSRCRARARPAGSPPRPSAPTASTRSAARRSGAPRRRGGSCRRPPRRARGGGPCPPAPARPSRRRSPRSASRGRRGAGSRGRCGRAPRRCERRLAGLAHVLRVAADAEELAVLAAHVAELGGDQRPLAGPLADRAADELLVRERAVHVGGVEEGHAELERAVDGARPPRSRRGSRRTRTCPCSRGRAETLRGPGCRGCDVGW